jgi:hypothetical protein
LDRYSDRIFISLASYRDAQLVPTIQDCIQKADFPDRLRIGVCQQREADEPAIPFASDPRIKVLDVSWRDTRGACWARSEAMRLWDGEEWYLQIDSHCRFASGWDTMLICSMNGVKSAKPIISTYGCAFTPERNTLLTGDPLQVGFRDFSSDGIPCFTPAPIPYWRTLQRPLRARFLAAGFLFAQGRFAKEIPYDPEIYFLGEEITLSLRAFTSGYDLFHPCEPIIWHEYKRLQAPKHWADHVASKGIQREWHQLDANSKSKVKQLLTGHYEGPFGLGTVRTLKEYESYAGLNFELKRAQTYTRLHFEPPNPEAVSDWAKRIQTWKVRIQLDRSSLPPEFFHDPVFWYVGFHDKGKNELHRKDLSSSEISATPTDQQKIMIERIFESDELPTTWTVWPKSRSAGWLQKVNGVLDATSRTLMA